MRLTLNKTRRNMALLLSVALVGAVLGFPSAATAADPTCTTASAVTTCTGETSDTAKYEIRVPDDFNGTLLLWSHGYTYVAKIPAQVPVLGGSGNDLRATIAPGAPDDMKIANALLNQGYALAGSGFAVPGWNAESAVKTNVELLGITKKKFTSIKRTVAWGPSLGGTITQRLAETNPKLIDAALPIMAFNNIDKVTGSNGGYGTDAVWLFKMFFDPTIKGFGYTAGPAGFGEAAADFGKILAAVVAIQGGLSKPSVADTWPATASLVPAAVKAALPARSALLMIGLLSGMPLRSSSFDGVTGTPIDTSSIAAASASTSAATGFSLAVQPALAVAENMVNIAGFATFARYDLETQVGNKNFADNQNVDYAKKLSEDERATYNVALSGEAGIDGLLALVAGFKQAAPLKADADALAKLKKLDTMTGQINVPTIAFNNTEETVEFQPMMSWMIEKANAQHAAAVAAAKAKKKKAPAKKFAAFWGQPLDEYTKFNAAGPVVQSDTPGTGHVKFSFPQWMDIVRLGDMTARLKRLPSQAILDLTRESDPNWYPTEDFDADTFESIGS